MKLRNLAIAVGLASIFLIFQNCGGRLSLTNDGFKSSSSIVTASYSGNGAGGYDGKTYVNIDVDGQCSETPGTEKSVIQVVDGKAYILKENCQPVPSREITTEIDLKSFDTSALVYGNRLFEKFDETKNLTASEVMCRGSQIIETTGQAVYADIFMIPTGAFEQFNGQTVPVYNGRVETGVYAADQSLLNSRTLDIEHVLKKGYTPTVSEYMIFAPDSETPETPQTPGSPTYSRVPYDLIVFHSPDGKDTGKLRFGSPLLLQIITIDTMDCYHH